VPFPLIEVSAKHVPLPLIQVSEDPSAVLEDGGPLAASTMVVAV